jgi:hypothetical protein
MAVSFRHRLVPSLAAILAVASPAVAQKSIGDLYSTDASVTGSVVLANSGTTVLSGSSIQAGVQNAKLRLHRGGDLLVCPGTTLSVTASKVGRELMYSLNSGNLEFDLPLQATADTLLTPDFRLLLPGPGRLHIAVQVDGKGDTCIQALRSDETPVIVTENLGDGAYHVKPGEAILFEGGRVSGARAAKESCGCPLPKPAQVAKATPAKVSAAPQRDSNLPQTLAKNQPDASQPAVPASGALQGNGTPASSTLTADEHLSVEAPFIFHGDDPALNLYTTIAHLKYDSHAQIRLETVIVPPPKYRKPKSKPAEETLVAENQKSTKRGFFARIGAFFAHLGR